MEFVPIKRSLSRLTENFSINFYGDDSVPGDLSQLSGFPDKPVSQLSGVDCTLIKYGCFDFDSFTKRVKESFMKNNTNS